MKLIRTILLLACALAICKVAARAGDAQSAARLVDSITVAPVVALNGAGITGAHRFGTGIDLGAGINKFVSLHVTALGYEDPDHWQGSTVDESELYAKATFARFKDETFVVYGKGGAVREWGLDLWGFGVGAGAELRFNTRVSVAGDYTVRAWFKEREKDSLARALVNFRF